MEKRTDYEAKAKFIKDFEEWRKSTGMTQREVMRYLELSSSANLALWLNPIEVDKPLIGLDKIKKLSKLSGIKFLSSEKEEMIEYLELKV
jgi:transcriptional regulator with XRE-family HTH domain